MKKLIKIIPTSFFALILLYGCSDGDNTIDTVLDTFETGAVLRTLEVISNSLNSSDPSSAWSVMVEEQDAQDGALLKSVGVYVTLRDLTSENGTTTTTQAFIKTIDASAFTTGPLGLPRTTISATFGEATTAMGLNAADDVAPGDLYVFELKLELTDGRIYGAADAGGIITGGYFSSPYRYNAVVSCSPEPGTYRLEMQDAYGDGWQNDGLVVTIDGVSTSYGAGSQNGGTDFFTRTANVDVPVGTSSLQWNWPGDSWLNEVSFQIYAPDGSLLGAFVGTIPLADYGCGCSITSVNGVNAVVAEPGLLPILLCAQ